MDWFLYDNGLYHERVKKHMIVVEIDELGHIDGDLDSESKRQEHCGYYLIRINPEQKYFNEYEEFGRL